MRQRRKTASALLVSPFVYPWHFFRFCRHLLFLSCHPLVSLVVFSLFLFSFSSFASLCLVTLSLQYLSASLPISISPMSPLCPVFSLSILSLGSFLPNPPHHTFFMGGYEAMTAADGNRMRSCDCSALSRPLPAASDGPIGMDCMGERALARRT